MAITVKGVTGELRRGYQVAATLGPWTLKAERCEAKVIEANAFFIKQDGPFSLRLGMGKRTWEFRDVGVVSTGDPLVVQVSGSPDVR